MQLSATKRGILELVAHGRVYKEIAQHLGLSRYTVDRYLRDMRNQYGARTNAELVLLAIRNGDLHNSLDQE